MKAATNQEMLVISLSWLDVTILQSGIMRLVQYAKGKMVDLRIAPREQNLVQFDAETESYEIVLSEEDLKKFSVIEISNISIPKGSLFSEIKIFMPDSTTKKGYVSHWRKKCYLTVAP